MNKFKNIEEIKYFLLSNVSKRKKIKLEFIRQELKNENLTSEEKKEILEYLKTNGIEILKEKINVGNFETIEEIYKQCGYYKSEELFYLDKKRKSYWTPEKEKTLLARYANGEDVTNEIVELSLNMAIYYAKKYDLSSLTTQDLIQEGVIGLMMAIKRFDITKSTRFFPYAKHYVKLNIIRAIDKKSRVIKLPVHINDDIRKLNKIIAQLTIELEREPTIDELAERMGKTKEVLLVRIKAQDGISSLNNPIDEENDIYLDSILKDLTKNTQTDLEEKELTAKINEILDMLGPRRKRVIELRYGLNNEDIHTKRKIGEILGVTAEYVRQLENESIKKLSLSYKEQLEDFK